MNLQGNTSHRRRQAEMDRKPQTLFISLLCLGLAIAILTLRPQLPSPRSPLPSTELRGVWLTNVASAVLFVPWGVNRALNQLAQLNFNTVYPVVWNRGHTFYPSSVARRVTGRSQEPLVEIMRLGHDVLAEIVKQGYRQNLRIVPWFEYGFMAPVGSELTKRHPEWIGSRRDGTNTFKEGWNEEDLLNAAKPIPSFPPKKLQQFIRNRFVGNQVWLNPLHPEVQQFILDLIVEVVTRYDVAGIQLDDHFGLPIVLGYDPYTVQLYQKEHQGKSPPDNPLDSQWMRWRADKITDFMQRLFQAVKSVKPNCRVSLSPNSQSFAYRTYLQDWQIWVERGFVEELVLQVYRDDLRTFIAELEQPAVQLARQKIPVGIGVLSGLSRRPVTFKQIQQQVQMVRNRGFDGVSFFYWESLWGYITPESPRQRRKAFQALFPSTTGY